MENNKKIIGTCPLCANNIVEGEKIYHCEDYNCKFKIYKDNKFWTNKNKELTSEIMETLLKDGKVFVEGFYSAKKEKYYNATVSLEEAGDYINFKMEFEKKEEDKEE